MAESEGKVGALVVGRCYTGSRDGQPQKKRARKGSCTRELAETFMQVLRDTCNVMEAARAVGKTTAIIYRWRLKDAAFRAAWDKALDEGYAALEMELLRRARFGQDVTEYRTGMTARRRGSNGCIAIAIISACGCWRSMPGPSGLIVRRRAAAVMDRGRWKRSGGS